MKTIQRLFLPLFLLALLLYSAYVLLDSFVIVRKIQAAPAPLTASEEASETPASAQVSASSAGTPEPAQLTAAAAEAEMEPVLTESSYDDGSLSVSITQERVGDSTVYVADVRLSSPEQLKTALAENSYGRNVTDTTSSIAESVDALLAVNGDFYGAQRSGYVIRNGVLYRSSVKEGAEDLVIYADGSFGIIQESQVSAQALLDSGAWNVLSFGPALVEDGQVAVSVSDEVGRARSSNPRTAIAVLEPLHYLFVVSDGRTEESEGLSLCELALFLQSRGALTAYNLDGGGSSTMVFNGRVVNNPTSTGRSEKERSVSDIVYVA